VCKNLKRSQTKIATRPNISSNKIIFSSENGQVVAKENNSVSRTPSPSDVSLTKEQQHVLGQSCYS
jgi:hypothetical protein